MPKNEIIETGKTVDAAIDSACEKLGCKREDCEWEIVDLPKKGFLGLKNIPAKVRVSIEIPEEKASVQKPATVLNPMEHVKSQPVQHQNPVKAQAPVQKSMEQKVQTPINQRPPIVKEGANEDGRASNGVISEEKIVLAKAYITDILSKMGLNADLIVNEEDGGICINIDGKGLGAIIGRRGETLDAIQYLTGLVANRIDGDYMRITIDCGDYRMKRKETLKALAKKLASQVLKTNVSRTLEPMNPFERRIIHATVSEIEGVTSISTGEEPNRRVVITTPSAKSRSGREMTSRDRNPRFSGRDGRPPRDSRNSGGGYANRPQRDQGQGGRDSTRRPDFRSASVPSPRNEPPKKTPESAVSNDKPLYTKIDLD